MNQPVVLHRVEHLHAFVPREEYEILLFLKKRVSKALQSEHKLNVLRRDVEGKIFDEESISSGGF